MKDLPASRASTPALQHVLLLMCCVPLLAVSQTSQPAPQKAPQITFTDVTEKVGIHWKHVNGATPDKYLIETMGGGAAFLDYNRDGRLDIFLVNSGCHKFSVNCTSSGNALYRQNADGTFTDVTKAAGLTSSGYGQGVAVGDFDNDGYPDIYVTGFPRNYLFHNNGDGTFTDITGKAGVAASGWSTSAVFFDYNHDGLPDLFVARYLDWDYDKNIWCGERRPGYRTYCHPDQFKPTSSILYRNNGDGTFTDVTKEAGVDVPGKALGAVAFDFNRDGWLDLFVANDAVRNHLFRNNKNGTFTEMALDAEVAYSSMGKPQSGMGVDAADVDGDGWPDLWVTNIDYEPNNLLHNNHDETFTDVTIQSHLGSVALLFSGFGTRFVDFDNDGWLDMFVLNGHPLDNVELYHEGVSAQERPFLLHNIGGKQFEEVGPQHGDVFTRKLNGRGLAVGDFDNDGDEDILLVQNGGSPILLRNDGGNRNAWIGFELEGTRSGRDAIGAVVTVTAGGRKLVRELVGGASYCSAHDQRLLIGLGNAEKVTNVVINWPSGAVSTEHDLVARRYYKLKEPGDAAPRARSSVSPP